MEHRRQALVPLKIFVGRVVVYLTIASFVVLGALAIGIFGYHELENYSWVDSFLNASMILGGMGQVNELHTQAGKIFAGWYALFSGVVFLAGASLILAPLLHRLLHRFHLEADNVKHGD
ncbi:MAG: hypothetical protein HY081_10825 [Gammaproteobacteria bacterium]|nr:hypothetical protein [Gammaproteobacteria bacterium]